MYGSAACAEATEQGLPAPKQHWEDGKERSVMRSFFLHVNDRKNKRIF